MSRYCWRDALNAFTECFEAPGEPFSSYCTRFKKQKGIQKFTDAQGWYPGIEYRPDLDPIDPRFFRDADASVVLPSVDGAPYSVAIVDGNGELLPDLFGTDFGGGVFSGTGNPGDAGVNFGVKLVLVDSHAKNQWVEIKVTPPAAPPP